MKRLIFVVMLIFLSATLLGCSGSGRKRSLRVDEKDVALLTIFADDGRGESNALLRNYGHAFFSVSNLTESSFVIGDEDVNRGETITCGLWNVLEHFGVWYNIESNYIKEYGKYSDRVSLTIGISSEDIESINKVINESDRWNPFFNCSTFALKVWNSVASEEEKIDNKMFVSPGYLVKEITKFEEHESGKECVTDNVVRYHKESRV